jgi:hypothetical protein
MESGTSVSARSYEPASVRTSYLPHHARCAPKTDPLSSAATLQSVKDIPGWPPGVLVEPRWGDDARFSVRGSGLFRNYGKGDVAMSLESIPINTSDGYADLFEIDPSGLPLCRGVHGSECAALWR